MTVLRIALLFIILLLLSMLLGCSTTQPIIKDEMANSITIVGTGIKLPDNLMYKGDDYGPKGKIISSPYIKPAYPRDTTLDQYLTQATPNVN